MKNEVNCRLGLEPSHRRQVKIGDEKPFTLLLDCLGVDDG